MFFPNALKQIYITYQSNPEKIIQFRTLFLQPNWGHADMAISNLIISLENKNNKRKPKGPYVKHNALVFNPINSKEFKTPWKRKAQTQHVPRSNYGWISIWGRGRLRQARLPRKRNGSKSRRVERERGDPVESSFPPEFSCGYVRASNFAGEMVTKFGLARDPTRRRPGVKVAMQD